MTSRHRIGRHSSRAHPRPRPSPRPNRSPSQSRSPWSSLRPSRSRSPRSRPSRSPSLSRRLLHRHPRRRGGSPPPTAMPLLGPSRGRLEHPFISLPRRSQLFPPASLWRGSNTASRRCCRGPSAVIKTHRPAPYHPLPASGRAAVASCRSPPRPAIAGGAAARRPDMGRGVSSARGSAASTSAAFDRDGCVPTRRQRPTSGKSGAATQGHRTPSPAAPGRIAGPRGMAPAR